MTKTLRAALIAAALITVPGIAAADCTLGAAPQLPNGATATEAEMVAAQGAVKAYLAETQEFLACLEGSSRGRGTEDVTTRYNAATKTMEKLAADFNAQLRAFKTRG